jgi:hypothetical protein
MYADCTDTGQRLGAVICKISDYLCICGLYMNPYTYKESKLGSQSPSVLALAADILSTNVHSLMAFALIALAATSVTAMSTSLSGELAAADYVEFSSVSKGYVLGETIVNSELQMEEQLSIEKLQYDTQTLFAGKYLTLTATPVEYSAESGKWNYRLAWKRA